jgi:hypothetical protein
MIQALIDLDSNRGRAARGVFACLTILAAACGGTADTASGNATPADTTPPAVTPGGSVIPAGIDRDGAEGAVAVIREYYDAIDAHDYRRAYLLWSDSGRASNQTFDAFRAGYANTASVTVRTGEPGRIEGAAGSRFIEIPVTIEARTTADSTQRFAGTYALRRAVVDGASDAQRRWHIHSADIRER